MWVDLLTWWKCCFYLGSINSAAVERWGESTKMLFFKFQSCCDSALPPRTPFQKQKHFPGRSRSLEQCGALMVDENCVCDLGYWGKKFNQLLCHKWFFSKWNCFHQAQIPANKNCIIFLCLWTFKISLIDFAFGWQKYYRCIFHTIKEQTKLKHKTKEMDFHDPKGEMIYSKSIYKNRFSGQQGGLVERRNLYPTIPPTICIEIHAHTNTH